ncbi:MAG: C-terminal target protein [Verrucomicrobiales bacterium]|nr:C-terminal target protein [Verrucomicrobiales bacterium]
MKTFGETMSQNFNPDRLRGPATQSPQTPTTMDQISWSKHKPTMKPSTPSRLLFGLLAAVSLAALLATPTRAATPATYSLAGDFTYAENNADSLWSFRMDDFANNPPTFLPLLNDTSRDAATLWGIPFPTPPILWSEGGGYWGIGKNTTGVEQSAGGVVWAPNEVLLHPKGGGSPARLVIAWRAPRAMVVNVHSSFRKAMTCGDGVGYELRTRIGGVDTEIIGFGAGNIGAGVTRDHLGLSFGAGDQLFFRIDTWANAGCDVTGAAVEITEIVGGPEITTGPSGGTVPEGGTFAFNVAATGATGYAWYKNGNLIPGAGSATYSVSDAQTSAAGSYLVVVTNTSQSVTSAPAVLAVTARPSYATVIFSENFNGYSGNQNNLQYQTGLKVSFGGTVPGWSAVGGGAIHAVDRSGTGNYAPMIWQDNVLTVATGLPANQSGETYHVDFVAAPATYGEGSQATTETDGMVIDVLRPDNTVLATYTCYPGTFGSQTFAAFAFQYVGDGSGDVRLRVGPLAATGHFTGAIDNLRLATDYVRPTPPDIVSQPVGGTVAEGANLSMSIIASGASGYQWRKAGVPISGANTASYSVVDAKPSDGAGYTVVLTNAAGSVTSTLAQVTVTARPSYATTLLDENFSAYTGNQNALQYQTGLKVSHTGNLPGWNKSGGGTVHGVDRTGTGDYAAMIWQDNVITVATPIAANESGQTYHVDFVAAPATYSEGSQATAATDGMVIEVLRGDYTVLATFTCSPGAWGTQSFTPFSFQYQGDGSGPVLVRVSPLVPSGHFAGAIDNLRLATDYVPSTPPEITVAPVGGTVPEGSDFSFTVLGSGLPVYQWTRGGTAIAGATNLHYSIQDVRTNDAGIYAVILSNPSGSVTSAPVAFNVTAWPLYGSYQEAVLTDNPIHYYPLDDAQGTEAADLGSLALANGAYLGGFALAQPAASSRLGSAVRLDGASGTLVDLGSFHPGNTISVEAWFLLDVDARVPWNAVVSRFDGSYELALNSDSGVSFAVRNDANTVGQVFSATPPARGQWHHIVGVFNGGILTVYLDGVKGQEQSIGGVLQNLGPTPDRVMIGSTRDGTGSSAFNLKGAIDEVAFYDTALSVMQVRAHYRAAQSPTQSLTVQRPAGGTIVVSWPSFSPGYVLQSATNVSGPYDRYTGNILVQGSQLTAEVPPGSAQRFFRLFKP